MGAALIEGAGVDRPRRAHRRRRPPSRPAVAIGDGAVIGERAALRDSIVLPGTDVAQAILIRPGLAGHAGIVESLRPRGG